MSFIIGTAGHIDHGKTSLVRALTGQDTDRLKEEKARGISIDLGFAHLDLPDNTRAGVVDVPGHERFIRNMLAGAHGIDLVLFTVAADDGVMPQTEEHLDILHLLGITRAIFVVTKADLVTPERLREVADDIAILTAGSSLDGSPAVAFSSVTGQGLDDLRQRIGETLRQSARMAPEGDFRLPVDRAFVLQGHGLVVTGTALSGSVTVGDRVRALPGDGVFRVRSLQVHARPVETAHWGQRVALNLGGGERSAIERGHVICHESLDLVSRTFDARLERPPTAAVRIPRRARVRVHVGTAERLGRLTVLDSGDANPAEGPTYCHVRLDEPVQVMRGDHFVVRDASARRTIGGGVVVHPWPRVRRRRDPRRQATIAALDRGAAPDAARTFLDDSEAFALPISRLRHFLNTSEEAVRALVGQAGGLRVFTLEDDRLVATDGKWRRLEAAVDATLQTFHDAHPRLPGMEMEALRGTLPFDVPPRLFRAVLDQLAAAAVVLRDGNVVRLAGHVVRLQHDDQDLADRIRTLLGAQALAPPELALLEKTLGLGRSRALELLRVLERDGSIVRVTNDLYVERAAIDRLKAEMAAHFPAASEVTPAAFRERFGTSRKYTIPLLEFLDREGITVRTGELRRMRHAPTATGR